MTAVTMTPQETVRQCWDVSRRACQIGWPEEGQSEISLCLADMTLSLDMCGRLRDCEWPEFVAPLLDKHAGNAADAAEALVKAIRAHCGDRVADYVRDGGQRP